MSTQTTTQPDHIWITDAVKADGPMRVRILGGPHGTDRQGQTFDTRTDFGRSKAVALVYYHGFNDENGITYLGEATKAERDAAGQWYVGELDDTPLGRRVYADAMAGTSRASSDAMAHLVRPRGIIGKPGHVSAWPIGAISLMDASTAGAAINPGAVVSAVKAYLDRIESEAGEVGAAKAGATFAKRNRDRIEAMRALLDEMMSEFPSTNEDAAMSAFGGHLPVEAAAKSQQNIMEDNIKPTEAAPVAPAPVTVNIENKLPDIADIVAQAVKANTPAAAPAPVGYSVEQVREAAEKAAAAVKAEYEQKLRDAQRPDLTPGKAPAFNKNEGDSARNAPFLWAAKASLATNGDPIVFNMNGAKDGFEYDGTAAAKAAFKAMATTAGGNVGDHFIPLLQANTVIDNLYQDVVTRKIPGITIYPMRSLIEYVPTLGSFSAGWSAENAAATAAGDAATGRKTLTAKNLTALATVSNQLLQDSTPAVEAFIRNGLARAIGEAHDVGALYGTNASNQPLGVTDTASVVSTAASSDDFYTAVIKALGRMDANKTPVGNRYVLARPETVAKAAATRASTGGDFLGAQAPMNVPLAGQSGLASLLSGRLGVPVFSTTAIPTVTGASEIIVGYAPDFIIGDRQELEISSSKEAGSAFANNQTLIRAIMRVDFVLARSTSIELVTGYLH